MTSPEQKPKVVSPIQLADLIDRDRRLLDNYLIQGTHSILPISRRELDPAGTRNKHVREWRDALYDLSLTALRESTPELLRRWVHLRKQIVVRGPLGIRWSPIPHRNRRYELDH